MGNPQETTELSGFELASIEWTNAKFFRDYFERSRRFAIRHQAERFARYELLVAMFEREHQDSDYCIQGLDKSIADYEKQMNQSESEMLVSMGGVA